MLNSWFSRFSRKTRFDHIYSQRYLANIKRSTIGMLRLFNSLMELYYRKHQVQYNSLYVSKVPLWIYVVKTRFSWKSWKSRIWHIWEGISQTYNELESCYYSTCYNIHVLTQHHNSSIVALCMFEIWLVENRCFEKKFVYFEHIVKNLRKFLSREPGAP